MSQYILDELIKIIVLAVLTLFASCAIAFSIIIVAALSVIVYQFIKVIKSNG